MFENIKKSPMLSLAGVLELIMIVLLFRPMQTTLDLQKSVRDNLSYTTKDMFKLSEFFGWFILILLVISLITLLATIFTKYDLMQTIATVTGILAFVVLIFQGIALWATSLFKDTRLVSMTGSYWLLLIIGLIVTLILFFKFRAKR